MQVEFEVGANLRIDQVVVGHQDYVGIILLHLLVKVRTYLVFFSQLEKLFNVKRLVGRQPCFIVKIRNFNSTTIKFTFLVFRTTSTVLPRFYLDLTISHHIISFRELFLTFISINGQIITYGCCATCHTQGVTLHIITIVRR